MGRTERHPCGGRSETNRGGKGSSVRDRAGHHARRNKVRSALSSDDTDLVSYADLNLYPHRKFERCSRYVELERTLGTGIEQGRLCGSAPLELVRSKQLVRRGIAGRFRGHRSNSSSYRRGAEHLFRNLLADIRNPQFEDLKDARRIRGTQRTSQRADEFSFLQLTCNVQLACHVHRKLRRGLIDNKTSSYHRHRNGYIFVRRRVQSPSPRDDELLLFTELTGMIDDVELRRLVAEALSEFDECEYRADFIMNHMMRRSQLQRLLTKELMLR